jgi:hypothetical protein
MHAGENLAAVLAQRAEELGPPIQMCDALSRNLPKNFQAVVANCIAHGRRKFVEVAAKFPEECRYVLETLGKVYRHDAFCREQGMSAEERLGYHQVQSGPLIKALENWFAEQFAERKVEPNSGLGQAITYMQNHWDKLTLFLRQPGAPLDNNLCERALKSGPAAPDFHRSQRWDACSIHRFSSTYSYPSDIESACSKHWRFL